MPFTPFVEAHQTVVQPTVSSSIDTSAIDPYRQGVELTLEKYYQEGPVKIHSGEDGHQMRPNRVGEPDDGIFPNDRSFQEVDIFDPIQHIQREISGSFLSSIIVFRAGTSVDATNMDGVLEPLTIRSVVSFNSIFDAFEPHAIRGNIESGNFNLFAQSDQIVSVQKLGEITRGSHPYEDNTDTMNGLPVNLGFFPNDTRYRLPFDDSQIRSGQQVSSNMDSDIQVQLKAMSPNTDSYVPFGYTIPVTGWDGNWGDT